MYKKGCDFSIPKRNETNSPWPGIIKLFTAMESLVSDIPAGDGKIATLFYSVQCKNIFAYTYEVQATHSNIQSRGFKKGGGKNLKFFI
jgi:hypothetical protein